LFSDENEYNTIDVSKPWRPDVGYDKLPRKKVKDEDFSDVAKTLLSRLRKEFDHYLSVLDDDMKVMTIVHPVGAGIGLE
jgi:predicted CopG family antitoxin